jgi:hypothetical protein
MSPKKMSPLEVEIRAVLQKIFHFPLGNLSTGAVMQKESRHHPRAKDPATKSSQ